MRPNGDDVFKGVIVVLALTVVALLALAWKAVTS